MVLENISRGIFDLIPGMKPWLKLLTLITVIFFYNGYFAGSPVCAVAYSWDWKNPVAPCTEMPSVMWFVMWLWLLYLLAAVFYSFEKVNSDTLIFLGLDYTDCCNAGAIFEKGDWYYILNQIKFFGDLFPGSIAYIALKTHFYRIGSSVIVEADCNPPGDLSDSPYELKSELMRKRGIFGVDSCVVGFMNSVERRAHLTFVPRKINPSYKIFDGKGVDISNQEHNTEAFLSEISTTNRHVHMVFELDANEAGGLKKRLGVSADVAKHANLNKEPPTGLSKLVLAGGNE